MFKEQITRPSGEWLKMNLYYLLRNKLDHLRFRIILMGFDSVETLMDIGCGNNPQKFIEVTRMHYTVDPAICKSTVGDYIHLTDTWETALKLIPKNYIDTVVLMDVVEHLEKKEALRLLEETKLYANQIVVFTPLGFLEQNDTENPWNCHRSAWHTEDFGEGWTVEVFPHFHWCDFKGKVFDKPKGAILAVWRK